MRLQFGIPLLALASALVGCRADEIPEVVDYNFDVVPVLAQHCFTCHGPDPASRKAELALHTQDGLFRSLREDSTGSVIVPHQPAASGLLLRVTSQDSDYRMPPPDKVPLGLSEYEVAVLERWIEQGATWEPHWAFVPPVRPEPGSSSDNPVDHFVAERLEGEGLSMSREADRRTLLRRLYLDLTGLPPGRDELHEHLEHHSYEEVVDLLLASPRFGERMATHWLDLARYADTNGYSIDGGRHMWLWRDWVIHAFNTNKPYDTFLTEQIAGDLLPDPTEAQLLASGFHRNHMITHEGGTIPEENLTNYVADRVKTTGEVFMGLTLACAQCHDHKYDPVTQRDYYQMFAFFNTVGDQGLDGDAGRNSVPFIEAFSPLASEAEIAEIRAELLRLRAELQESHPDQPAWERRMADELARRGRGLRLHPLSAEKVTTPNSGYTGEIREDGSVFIGRPGGLAAYNVSAKLPDTGAPVTGLRIVFYPGSTTGSLGYGGKLPGSFVLTSVHVSAGPVAVDQVDLHRSLPIRRVTATTEHPEYPASDALDERRIYGWSPDAEARRQQHFTATFRDPITVAATPFITVMLGFGQGDNLIPAHFRVYAMEGTDDGHYLSSDVQAALLVDSEARSLGQEAAVRNAFVANAAVMAPVRHRVVNLKARQAALTEKHSAMVMNSAEEPRQTFVLNRGQYDQPLDAVEPGVPGFLPPFTEEPTRLGLARWLTDPKHPLTARVAVNQFWQLLFGRGLVATAADFGARGAIPSHPKLLDWLAVEFVQSGFDVKALLRLMVMSDTYRQSSAATPELLERDPNNIFLARASRVRLQAEFIRDSALKISGLLRDHIGGPSVRPYQPAGLWKEISHYGSTPATAQVYVQDHGEHLYRRSLYTYWKRTAPPPAMLTFDAPTREVCTITRERTNTPLQALVLLNDPQFVEASRVFAEKIMREAGPSVADRVDYAYEEVTGLLADSRTALLLARRFAEERDSFSADPESAIKYLSVGESPHDEELDAAEHAAWTIVASLLLNLSETITRS